MPSRPIRSLQTSHMRLDFLSIAGPRLVGLYLAGSNDNLLAETPDISWNTPYGTYHLIGGHRLWIAPESYTHTAIPDDHGLGVTEIDGKPDTAICLTQPPDAATHISRSIEIYLQTDHASLTLIHRLTNAGSQSYTCAAWAITQLPLGGIALLPFMDRSVDEQGLQPNRNLVLWPYTQLDDTRFHFNRRGCMLKGIAHKSPCKIGSFNHLGWIGYFWRDFFFSKRFSVFEDRLHLDQHCNAELYVYDRFIELETLSPVSTIEPGASITHTEQWQVFRLKETLDFSPSDTLFDLADSFLAGMS